MVPGGKENNEVLRTWGDQPAFDFEPKDHVELVESLGLVDYKRGTKIGGSGYWLYRGDGARLEWGLINYFIEQHIKDGYEFVLPPHILTGLRLLGWHFYTFIGDGGARFMCPWNTTDADVDALLNDARNLATAGAD